MERHNAVWEALTDTMDSPHAAGKFRTHIAAHSRDKPGTARRYSQILEHLERLLGTKGFIESSRVLTWTTTRSVGGRNRVSAAHHAEHNQFRNQHCEPFSIT